MNEIAVSVEVMELLKERAKSAGITQKDFSYKLGVSLPTVILDDVDNFDLITAYQTEISHLSILISWPRSRLGGVMQRACRLLIAHLRRLVCVVS